jgi:hypothetical protein
MIAGSLLAGYQVLRALRRTKRGSRGSVMNTLVLLSAVVLMVAPAAARGVEPIGKCAGIVQRVSSRAAAIAGAARVSRINAVLGETALAALVLIVVAGLATASAVVVDAAPVNSCTQIVQNINTGAAAVAGNTNSYWAHREKYVDLMFGQAQWTDPDPLKHAQQEKSQGDALRGAMPNSLASFKGLVATARSQNCLTASQLSAIAEPAIKRAKRVNFDQFPQEESTESSIPPQLPNPPGHTH